MQTRTWSSVAYRFGFNGQEMDDEINVDGGSYDFGARIYDGRLGRWLSLDPIFAKYPWFSPYVYVGDNPIYWIDKDGRDLYATNEADKELVTQSVALVLGNTQDIFKFNGDKLEFNANFDPKNYSPEQNKFIEEFNKQIVSKSEIQVYVHYSEGGTDVRKDKKGKDVKTKLTVQDPEITKFDQENKTGTGIVDLYVNSNSKAQGGLLFEDLTPEGNKKAKKISKEEKKNQSKENSKKIAFLHGIGHALLYSKGEPSGNGHEKKTVGFENFIRGIIGLPERAGKNHGGLDQGGSEPYFPK